MKIDKHLLFDPTKRLVITSLGVLALAGSALAADTTSGYSELEQMEQPATEHVFQVNPGFTYTADADFNNSSLGKLSVWRFDIPAHYTIKTEPGDLKFGVFYEYSEYNLDKLDATQDFNTLAFDTVWKGMLNDEWGYFLYGAVSMSASTHAALSDGLTGAGGAGVRYVWSKDLSLGLGAAVATRLEDDPFVLPVIALNWQINDRWNLQTLNGATISYDVSGDKAFLLDLGAKYQRREYRVQDNASLTDKMMTLELGATYRFAPEFALRGFVGMTAGRNIEFRQNNEKITDQDVDPAPFVGVRALFTF
ncbi:MAG: DUF6268 family outer membrane beta-barrel protein [Verrucomicrobia bacterium]|nr:DUF6268 family outer membrane beta-barrel protein [Verrucomicrobiota bacterium]